MAKFILGKKLNMTQKFTEGGLVMPVTAVSAGPCTIVQVKGKKDAYNAIQVGYGSKKKVNKAMAGHLKDLSASPNTKGGTHFRYLKEFRVENSDSYERGKVFDVSSFKVGDIVEVIATSKGKGFQGVVRRHGFHGSPATHGHKDQLRMPGSIGATDAARVFKGTRMGGRMGGDTVTVKNLELIEVDVDNNILYIKGAVPGARGSLVEVIAPGELVFVELNSKKEAPNKEEEKIENTAEIKEEVKTEEKIEEKVEEVKTEEDPKVELPLEEEPEKIEEKK